MFPALDEDSVSTYSIEGVVGSKDEQDAIALYKELLGRKAVAESH